MCFFYKIKEAAKNLKSNLLYRKRCKAGIDVWISPSIKCKKICHGQGDGKWVISQDSLCSSSLVYSVGIGNNISFDLDLIKHYGVNIHAFDPTPISENWLQEQTLPEKFHFHRIGIANFDGVADFKLPAGHGVSFSILDIEGGQPISCKVARLESIMQQLGHQQIDLLKLDIEGAEYGIIDDLIANGDKINQILIEFHHRLLDDADSYKQTKYALDRLNDSGFKVFHVSARGLEFSLLNDRRKNCS
jgi:FkbM family methyltransferase